MVPSVELAADVRYTKMTSVDNSPLGLVGVV